MAKTDYKELFDNLTKTSPTQYKKEWLKDSKAARKKAKGGLVLSKFVLGGKSPSGVFLHFPKTKDAEDAYKFWIDEADKDLKKSGNKLYQLKVSIEDIEGVEQFTMSKLKGVYKAENIYEALKDLFPEGGKRSLKIDGYVNKTETTAEPSKDDNPTGGENKEQETQEQDGSGILETNTDNKTTKKEERKAKRIAESSVFQYCFYRPI